MSTLLGIRNLVFDLDGTSTGFDHALGEQIGSLFVTEARIDVSDDWHHVGFVVVDLLNDAVHITAIGSCFVQFDKDMAQFPRIGLLEEGIDLFDQIRHGSFFRACSGLAMAQTASGVPRPSSLTDKYSCGQWFGGVS